MESTMNQTIRTPLGTPDPAHLRRTLGCFATGVAVITTLDDTGTPFGVTVNSFNSVSLDPPLILWSLARTAFSLPVFHAASGFTVNILASDQVSHCKLFSSREEERFNKIDWHRDSLGHPVLSGALATLTCRKWAVHDGGDHEIFIGQVIEAEHHDLTPLGYCKGALGPLAIG